MAKKLQLELGKNSYEIHIEKGLLGDLASRLRKLCKTNKIFIITDSVVDDLYGDIVLYRLLKEGFTPRRCVVAPGERSKSLEQAEKIYSAMADFNMTRDSLLLTLGGGVIGDLGGFVAATYMRGVPLVQIPTTLLAQVDSSVGGKVAVNLQYGKNLVGLFYQPSAVFIDPLVLNTLSDKNFNNGMAEVIKYGCIKDEGVLSILEKLHGREQIMGRIEEIIFLCCCIKREFVERDERDNGERMLLNFGHTLGHAIESLSCYGYSHGESVAMGMQVITELGEDVGITEPGTSGRLKKLLSSFDLPCQCPAINGEDLCEAIRRDKKNRGGELNLVLLRRAGKACLHKTSVNFFDRLAKCA